MNMFKWAKRMPLVRSVVASWATQFQMAADMRDMAALLKADHLERYLYQNSRYDRQQRLNQSEFRVFSQNGEDGLIAEIFRRIGTTNRYFVEFGVQNGLECNSAWLLLQGWRGLWIEGSHHDCQQIDWRFKQPIQDGRLALKNRLVTNNNLDSILCEVGAPEEPDMLSIDIDFNDYHVWNGLSRCRPRVVVIEYNAFYRPPLRFVVPYVQNMGHRGDTYFGASLQSMVDLGTEKGYSLVACCYSGVNAFFVRSDLVKGLFPGDRTAEYCYEPYRDFLGERGLKREFGGCGQ